MLIQREFYHKMSVIGAACGTGVGILAGCFWSPLVMQTLMHSPTNSAGGWLALDLVPGSCGSPMSVFKVVRQRTY